jgi:hypothetical protein
MPDMRSIANACLVLALMVGLTSFCVAQSAAPPAPTPVAASADASANATSPAAQPVKVTSNGNQLEVKVPDQAPLSTVMSSVCQEQKIQCTGTETLTTYHGPAMSVEGTLRQVIAKLVEGTDINYEFSRSAEGGATSIAFLGHAPKGSAPVPTPEERPVPTFKPLHSHPFPGTVPTQPPPPPPQSELQEPPDVNPSQPASVSNVEAQDNPEAPGQSLPKAETMLFTGAGGPTQPYLPFPDAQGQPIPISDKPATVLPFPDQFGNPIPVKPGPTGSPFPWIGPTSNSGTETKQ